MRIRELSISEGTEFVLIKMVHEQQKAEVNSQFQIFLFLFLNLLSCRSERFNCQAPVQGQSVAFGHTQTRQPVPGGDASFTVQPPVTPTLNLFKSVSRLWTHVISWSSLVPILYFKPSQIQISSTN